MTDSMKAAREVCYLHSNDTDPVRPGECSSCDGITRAIDAAVAAAVKVEQEGLTKCEDCHTVWARDTGETDCPVCAVVRLYMTTLEKSSVLLAAGRARRGHRLVCPQGECLQEPRLEAHHA